MKLWLQLKCSFSKSITNFFTRNKDEPINNFDQHTTYTYLQSDLKRVDLHSSTIKKKIIGVPMLKL